MSGVSTRSRSLTGSALGKRTRNESETAEAVFSKKRKIYIDSEIKVSLFVAISREIRDMIVGNLLRAGDLGILQVSKALSEEALQRTNQEATCRIYYGCPDHADSNFPRPVNPAGIRNVEFHFHMTNYLWMHTPTMTQFREDCAVFRLDECNTAPKSTCNLTLTYGTLGLGLPSSDMLNMFLHALRPLTGFEKVVLKVVREPVQGLLFNMTPRSGPELQAVNERRLKPLLEHLLGAVTMVGEGDGRRMVFHPRSLNTEFFPGQYKGEQTRFRINTGNW